MARGASGIAERLLLAAVLLALALVVYRIAELLERVALPRATSL